MTLFFGILGGILLAIYLIAGFFVFMSEDWSPMSRRLKDAALWPVVAVFFLLAGLFKTKSSMPRSFSSGVCECGHYKQDHVFSGSCANEDCRCEQYVEKE